MNIENKYELHKNFNRIKKFIIEKFEDDEDVIIQSLKSHTRDRLHNEARRIFVGYVLTHLKYKNRKVSYHLIGNYMKRTHASIINQFNKHQDLYLFHRDYREKIDCYFEQLDGILNICKTSDYTENLILKIRETFNNATAKKATELLIEKGMISSSFLNKDTVNKSEKQVIS